MEQLTATVRNNTESAREVTQLVMSTADIAVQGGEHSNKMVMTMTQTLPIVRKKLVRSPQ